MNDMSHSGKRIPRRILAEFRKRFFSVRFKYATRRGEARLDSPGYGAALALADQYQIPGGRELLQASLADHQGKQDEAMDLLVRNDRHFSEELASVRDFLVASIHTYTGQYAQAEEILLRLIGDRTFSQKRYALGNVVYIYNAQGRYDEVIKIAQRLSLDDQTDIAERALLMMGHAFRMKGDTASALMCFQKVLGAPDSSHHPRAWGEVAKTLFEQGKLKEAQEAVSQALSSSKGDPRDHTSLEVIQRLLTTDLAPDALSEDDKQLLDRSEDDWTGDSLEERIIAKIESARQSQYDAYLQQEGSGQDNVLSILRGWSSAVTLLEGSASLWTGGGYLIRWRGYGIVIDPGFDFLRNLHDAGYHGREIDAVIVSHNHPDHNADLTRLDDLRYELYKRRASDPHRGVTPYTLLLDRDSNTTISFSAKNPQHQHRPMVFDVGRCNPSDTLREPHGLPFSVEYFGVRHGELENAVGFCLHLHSEAEGEPDVIIGYTGDTEYFPELAEHLSSCHILLAHISQPDLAEFSDPTHRKRVHLGYRGLAELVQTVQPELTLVGEFWAGLADLRIDLVAGVRRLAGTDAILPTGLGMDIALPSREIRCTDCGRWHATGSTRVAPPAQRYGKLAFLCQWCILQ